MGLPAILKGWFERVFAYGVAYTLDLAGWKGSLDGRVPLLTQEKELVGPPTFLTKRGVRRRHRDPREHRADPGAPGGAPLSHVAG
jgi:hypothetical protein